MEDLKKLENSGALGKIVALAITTEEELQRTGNKPGKDVLAQKHMLDAMSPALRSELGQLFENVTGQTTIIFAPRESVVSEPQADFYFSMPLVEPSGSKTTPRGQILNIKEALAEQRQNPASEQLEVAA